MISKPAHLKLDLQYGLLMIEDRSGGQSPEILGDVPAITYTDSCVAVACINGQIGITNLTIGSIWDVDPGYQHSYEGIIATPTRSIALRTAVLETLFETSTVGESTKIRIWLNESSAPDVVVVGLFDS